MAHWNHRVIETPSPDGEVWLAIHEVHYDDTGKPQMYTSDPVDVSSETVPGLMLVLHQMHSALDKPALKPTDFPAADLPSSAADEPMRLTLCEAATLLPWPNRLYMFTRVPGCAECDRLAAMQLEAYGAMSPTSAELDAK